MKYLFNFYEFKISYIFNNISLFKILKNYYFYLSNNFIINNLLNKNLFINNFYNCKKKIFFKDIIKIKFDYFFFFKKFSLDFDLPIIFEDDNLIVIKKSKNKLIHPTFEFLSNSVINNLLYYYGKKILLFLRLGILNRLDRNSTGLMLLLKSNKSYLNLIKQIKFNILKRYYITLVDNRLDNFGKIVCNIKKNNKSFFSETNFFLLKIIKKNKKLFSLVKCNLLSGRTNQIRIHFNEINNPLCFDDLYKKNINKNNFLLMSYYISFYHPCYNYNIKFSLSWN